ncbi:polysaccharide pyruvyl transferase family protein [Natrialbaceae archaeon AArc-T1-2]|uniref:polysaccharide pyruvyl transferase family protein n=1 Tax=Natrialbaceae archaeon AArc-T1-2 TaxID=3053904 RepID=UPI00255AAC15|nr:polysaccharide pyruvyl transferase family protein [Natrialbaceae archaeon AArc-T1-2]WIV68828.1 polysaccharide pyruvyl transferase family protein [Natrialbaceae archaeon AArc-T1-2]
MKNELNKAGFGAALGSRLALDRLKGNGTARTSNDCENIVIVGGDLCNKGAQAMTYTLVDQLSRRFPQKEIYLFSSRDYYRDTDQNRKFTFNILPWGVEYRSKILARKLPSNVELEEYEEIKRVLNDCKFMIDINGYALSSQRGFARSLLYMSNISVCKSLSIPMYIFPQSIGPFDYGMGKSNIMDAFLNLYLDYPQKIYSREQEGVTYAKKYTNNDVEKSFDIVLQFDEYQTGNIFKNPPDLRKIEIADNAAGIIPNSKVKDRMNEKEFYNMNKEIVNNLLDKGKDVYIIRHAEGDKEICQTISQIFSSVDGVHTLSQDYDPITLETIIGDLDYIIGSRYHSLIHAYKNSVPAVAIGWATKYRELLSEFDQLEYFFESRYSIDIKTLGDAIEKMESNYKNESEIIAKKRKEIQSQNILSELPS